MANPNAFRDFWGAPIHVYTRAEALADGVLVDVTKAAQEVGFRLPVAMTKGVWSEAVAWSDDPLHLPPAGQDERGRLWDVLMQARIAARRARNESVLTFDVLRVIYSAAKPTKITLKMAIGPGDGGEPIITILLPGED